MNPNVMLFVTLALLAFVLASPNSIISQYYDGKEKCEARGFKCEMIFVPANTQQQEAGE